MSSARQLGDIRQICIVVKDLKATMEQYWTKLGIGPFRIYSLDTNELAGVTYRGQPANYRLQVAFATIGPLELELIEPQGGDSSYQEFLDRHGEGVQHVGIYVQDQQDHQAAFAEMVRRGFKHLQGGPIPGKNRVGRFDYFETNQELGTIYELLDFPEQRADPEETYP